MGLIELRPAELDFCGGASSFLQTDFWGNFKARFGWKAFAFSAKWETTGDATILPLLVLYHKLGPGIGFAYIPWGPELPLDFSAAANGATGDGASEPAAMAAELAVALRSFLPKQTAFIRFDFPWFTDQLNVCEGNIPRPFTRAADVQPPNTVLVDLAPAETAILANMKSKWRYNIGLAEKKGVAVRCIHASAFDAASSPDAAYGTAAASPDNRTAAYGELEIFYNIYRETAARDGIAIHPKKYYAAFFEVAAMYNIDARLYIASHEGEDLAGIVTLFRGRVGVYLYGASSNNKRNLMAPYALQWKAMRDAKAAGCFVYDMYGIPPRPPTEKPNHPMAGLYRFKTGFIGGEGDAAPAGATVAAPGGSIVHRPGCWDYPCRPVVKALYSIVEKTRKKMWDLKKRLRRR